MTHDLVPGAQLFTDGHELASGPPLTVIGAVEAAIRAALPTSRETLLTADAQVLVPEAFATPEAPASSATVPEAPGESRDTPLTVDAVVTACAPAGGEGLSAGTRVEITARISTKSAAPVDQFGRVAEVRFAFLADLPAPDGLLCPGSRPWIAELGARLHEDARFAELIETYDGTIGLSIAGRDIHLRCYRGSLIEASARSILGADFVLEIPGAEFVALMQADHNAFMESAMLRRMSSTGSGYEYLRMTNALIRIIDICRDIAVSAGYAQANADPVAATTLDSLTRETPTFEEV